MATYIGITGTLFMVFSIALVLNALRYTYASYMKYHTSHYMYWDFKMRRCVNTMDKLMVITLVLFLHQYIIQKFFQF